MIFSIIIGYLAVGLVMGALFMTSIVILNKEHRLSEFFNEKQSQFVRSFWGMGFITLCIITIWPVLFLLRKK